MHRSAAALRRRPGGGDGAEAAVAVPQSARRGDLPAARRRRPAGRRSSGDGHAGGRRSAAGVGRPVGRVRAAVPGGAGAPAVPRARLQSALWGLPVLHTPLSVQLPGLDGAQTAL